MPIHIPVITKTHAVSCNIGIAYTAFSYFVSTLLHNCFQIVNFGDIRDIEVQTRHFLISICYTKENKFPKRPQQQEKRTSQGKQSPETTSGARRFTPKSKSGQTLQRISARLLRSLLSSLHSNGHCAIDLRDKRIFNDYYLLKTCIKRVDNMLITKASR